MCFYTKVVEIYLFRTLTDPNVPRPKLGLEEHIMNRITRRGNAKVRSIYITQGYGTILPLEVQDFDASSINLEEIPNNERNLYNVPFQLVDVEDSTRTMQKFVISSIKHYIKDRLRTSDHITQALFDLGLQAANDKSVSEVRRTPRSQSILKIPSNTLLSSIRCSTFGQPRECWKGVGISLEVKL